MKTSECSVRKPSVLKMYMLCTCVLLNNEIPYTRFYKQQAMRHYNPSSLYLLLFKKNAKYIFKLTFIHSDQPG